MKKKLLFLLLLVVALALVGADAPAEDEAPQASGQQATEEPPETFVPSEKLPADSAISFPVDI